MMNRRESIKVLSGGVLALLAGGSQLLANSKPRMTVYKSPSCGCCGEWVKHVRSNGFEVVEVNVDDVVPFKKKYGVPLNLASCHTAVVGEYAFEGHVPADLIHRLLKAAPRTARALAVPGMPAGSPGMEVGNRKDPYDVILINRNGSTSVFAKR